MMKPEHTKEFNAEHAQAGATYCQRNGLAARIGIWDGRRKNYPLVGEVEYLGGIYGEVSWTSSGIFSTEGASQVMDLVMLPLGYCEGKPVFVGDELENTLPNSSTFIVYAGVDVTRDNFRWPRKAPVVPVLIHGLFQFGNAEFNKHALDMRPILEAYWKELDAYQCENASGSAHK